MTAKQLRDFPRWKEGGGMRGWGVWGKGTRSPNAAVHQSFHSFLALFPPFNRRATLDLSPHHLTPPPIFFSRLKRGRGPFKARPSLPQNFPVSALFSIPDGRPGSPPSW